MTVDARLDELAVLLARAGVPAPAPPPDVAALEAIDRAVAPLRLPVSARCLWERVDVRSFGLDIYPALATPEFALRAWRHERDTELIPARLFPLCYESWSYVFIELHAPEADDGGTLFEWMYGGADFEIAYDDLEDWLAVQMRAMTAGDAELANGRLRLTVPVDRRLSDVGHERLKRRGPHAVYGTMTAIPEDDWPERWR
jgi:hypothetical protein